MNYIGFQPRFQRYTCGVVKGRRVSKHCMFATDWRISAQGMNRQESYTLDPAGNLTRQIIVILGKTAWGN
jgi:hypothetical protein